MVLAEHALSKGPRGTWQADLLATDLGLENLTGYFLSLIHIFWYTANRQNSGTYTVNVKASAHKNSTGLYNIHLYYCLLYTSLDSFTCVQAH